MAFALNLDDGTTTLSFIGGSIYELEDGGFQLDSFPEPDAFEFRRKTDIIPIYNTDSLTRNATIRFRVYGATRDAIRNSVRAVNMMLEKAIESYRSENNDLVRLTITIDGATGSTYFRVYWGAVSPVHGHLSLEQDHLVTGGGDLFGLYEAKLTLSAYGYAYGPRFTGIPTAYEVAISASGQSAATGGRTITNPSSGTPNANWIEIANSQLNDGDGYETVITIDSGTASYWNFIRAIFIGHTAEYSGYAFPSTLLIPPGSFTNSLSWGVDSSSGPVATFGNGVDRATLNLANTFGEFLCIHSPTATPAPASIGTAVYDYTDQGFEYSTPLVPIQSYPYTTGFLSIPPDYRIKKEGNLSSVGLAIHFAQDTFGSGSETTSLAHVYLLPCDQGLRIFRGKISTTTLYEGLLVDKGIEGTYWLSRDSDSKKTQPYFAMYNPVILPPNVDQRLYFYIAPNLVADSPSITATIRVYAIPRYKDI